MHKIILLIILFCAIHCRAMEVDINDYHQESVDTLTKAIDVADAYETDMLKRIQKKHEFSERIVLLKLYWQTNNKIRQCLQSAKYMPEELKGIRLQIVQLRENCACLQMIGYANEYIKKHAKKDGCC